MVIANIRPSCRYNPETDGRVLLGSVDCTEEAELCKRYEQVDDCFLALSPTFLIAAV